MISSHQPDHQVTLQRIAFPDPDITDQAGLFVHLSGAAVLDVSAGRGAGRVTLPPDGVADFGTYVNLFNLGTWGGGCDLASLGLRLQGLGRLRLDIWHVRDVPPEIIGKRGQPRPAQVWDRGPPAQSTEVALQADGVLVDLSGYLSAASGLIMLRLTALEAATLTGGAFEAGLARPLRDLRLAISITTFRREAEVAITAARVTAFLAGEGAPYLTQAGARAHLFMVDNGQSATPAPHPILTVIPNTNLGGAGGFARGLAAAQDGGFTHCLFMDDDASFQMENLLRTIAFLQLAKADDAAVAGAMISAGRPWMMWENGAVFRRMCRPQSVGADLREPRDVAEMELQAAQPKPDGFYAGWWYFAFPVAAVHHFPFPFFVRGDDISFSLAHRFKTVTLNGVVSFQEDFSAKESPMTLYLDMRNHLHHHLVQAGMDIGRLGTARILTRFLLRSIVRMHYDSADAQLMAWEDVMAGPDFFARNADMTAKRPIVNALIRSEAWRVPAAGDLNLPQIDKDVPPGIVYSALMKFTLNGHLLPFWGLIGARRRIPVSHRGVMWAFWGLREASFTNADSSRAYRVVHNKRRAFGLIWRAGKMLVRWCRIYPELQAAHREGYDSLANRTFWEGKFLVPPANTGG